jgi:Holliday junction resolvase-like predicted endonuclease
MIKVKAISVREKEELEPLLIANPEIIEEGLKVITHQHPTDSGPLDILAVDSEGTLAVVELKNEAADSHLDQGLRYYDWCRQNISWIANAYKGKTEINADATPRLMLIAPAFTDTVRRIAKYIDVELDLIEYHAFENEKGERGLICTAIDFGQAPVPPEIPSIEKKMEYFQSEKVKDLFRSVLDGLGTKQVEIKPIHELWISFWYGVNGLCTWPLRETSSSCRCLPQTGTGTVGPGSQRERNGTPLSRSTSRSTCSI